MRAGFFEFVKQKVYLLVFCVLCCILAGSIKGAAAEEGRWVGITDRDIEVRQQLDNNEITDAPVFIGQLEIASEQNEFYSFKLGAVFGAAGVLAGLLLMRIYYCVYYSKFWQKRMAAIKPTAEEKELFFKL